MFETFLDIFLDALKDSALTLPVLFICYLLIELLEERILNKYQKNKMLKSKFAPIVSAGFGLIPQCGFSVVASELYSKRIITIGSLFAILIATSDEALPIMLSNPANYLNLFLIIIIKFVYAVLIGLLLDVIFKNKKEGQKSTLASNNVAIEKDVHGCCHHALEHSKHSKFKEVFVHPLIHSLKIFCFILIINIAFGILIHFVGEDSISNFMLSTGIFQVFIVALVGIIPNCAASVIITEMFISGGITLGSCIAGLCVNSGLAIVMLFKFNKNKKESFAILASLYGFGCLAGLIISLF